MAEENGGNMGRYKYIPRNTAGGWEKEGSSPVIGGALGTVFDCCVREDNGEFRIWYSWRPARGIAMAYSTDGIHWSLPQLVMPRQINLSWAKDEVNRPCVLYRNGKYLMWFIGMVRPEDFEYGHTAVGYAESMDGIHWDVYKEPVMVPEKPWEKSSLYCPHVIWDDKESVYKMWYSGGEQYECDCIGYAESKDGIHWEKYGDNPVFTADKSRFWEALKTEACCVIKDEEYYYMFYLGISADRMSAIGVARSRDGISRWERHPDNPVVAGTDGGWDYMGVCKPFVLWTEEGYRMWYNGCNQSEGEGQIKEEIGVARHKGHKLWPDSDGPRERNIPDEEFVCRDLFLGCR